MIRFSKRPTAKLVWATITFVLAAVVLLSAAVPAGYASANDTTLSVTVPCQPPGTPGNPSPADGATGRPISLTLDWPDCANTDTYDIYFGTEADPVYLDSTADSSYAITGLSYSTRYYWRVVAENDCGQTSGIVWSFTTRSRPGGGGGGYIPPEPVEPPAPEPPTEPVEPPAPEPPAEPVEPPAPEPPAEPVEPGFQLVLEFWDQGRIIENTWDLDANGTPTEDVYGSALDASINVFISQGTVLKGPDGGIITLISILRPLPHPAPPPGYAVIEAFEFQPAGATFDPEITITVNFDAMLDRTDLQNDRPFIAVYNPDADTWTFIEGTVDFDRSEISFKISHFSIYAVLADAGLPPISVLSQFNLLYWIPMALIWAAILILMFLILRKRRSRSEPEEDASV